MNKLKMAYWFLLFSLFPAGHLTMFAAEPLCNNTMHHVILQNGQICKTCNDQDRQMALECMGNYIKYCTLAEKGKGVTRESMIRFEVLFHPNARIFDDVRIGENGHVAVNDYITEISQFFVKRGLNIEYKDDAYLFLSQNKRYYLENEVEDEDGHSICEYQMALRKTLKSGVDTQNKLIERPRIIELKLFIRVSRKTGFANIVKIEKLKQDS